MLGTFLALVLLVPVSEGKLLWGSGPVDLPPASGSSSASAAPPPAEEAPEGGVLASLVTTCSSLIRMYPADAVNYFYKGRHKEAYFYAYLLLSPPSESARKVVNEWRDPEGVVICRKETTFQPQLPRDLVKAGDESYAFFLFVNHVGLDEAVTASGQSRAASQPGLYSVSLKVDGKETARTFFRVREALPENQAAPGREEIRQILPEPFRNRDLE